ncbi:hypothetical protein C7Y71_000045 [Pseudoprevotella muciniphila]|uniref:Uncharacterized protein n=1 Tax=Pseudoprevotella muciniphila TaxID=2133944 RepID=A0A5P8E3L4_9BACT|nr:hypothetical protein [Pseudoprevotella muciniphila]QFQ11551.1 hypothetical protein C7Y71_000045 [Pseudoprevotella muciniphila]
MGKVKNTFELDNACCICGRTFSGKGHNPAPVRYDGVCCGVCNVNVVLKERFRLAKEREKL